MEPFFDLSGFGLTTQQAKIYQTGLKLGSSPVSRIARASGVHRVTTYNTLKELVKKGFSTSVQKSNTSHYQMVHPEMIQHHLQEKALQFGQLLPGLVSLMQQNSSSFSVRVFEGFEGVSHLYLHLLKSKTPLRAWMGADHMDSEFRKWLYEVYLPQRVARNISSRAIVSDTIHNQYFADEKNVPLTEVKIISNKSFSLNCEIILFDEDKLLIATMATGAISGMLVESKLLHESMGSIFELVRGTN